MGQKIGLVALIVPEYQAGLDFFVGALGFELVEDRVEDRVEGSKRWIVVRPRGADTGLVIARAVGPEQKAAIGNQSGGRVGFFLHTDDFERDAARITAAGGSFEENPRHETYGTVAVFRDPFGNRWDLIQPAT